MMLPTDQSPGGGVESNLRQVRSATEAEPIVDSEVPAIDQPEPPVVPSDFDNDRIGINPRRCSTPTPSPVSRSSSARSSSGRMSSSSAPPSHPSPGSSGSFSTCPHGHRSSHHHHHSHHSRHNSHHHSHHSHHSHRLEPPVTKATLSELDVGKILLNPKLRHDINFDPELHFRPNLDGAKGMRKQERANQFWGALLEQLRLFVTDRAAFIAQHGGPESRDWCLPILLRAIKDIIMTLVPVRDRAYVDEGLDLDLLLQQFHHGVADLEKLARWLATVLKSHCAPMRDDWVDETYALLSTGNRDNDLPELVRGLRNLLNVLEAMKLDVANHQIRCLRPVLIEDTVHFEQRYHAKRVRQAFVPPTLLAAAAPSSSSPSPSSSSPSTNSSTGTKPKLDPEPAACWYRDAVRLLTPVTRSDRRRYGDSAAFFHGLVRLVMPSTDDGDLSRLHVFQFDEDRLAKTRSDLLDAINLEVCMRLYEALEARCSTSTAPPASHSAPSYSYPCSYSTLTPAASVSPPTSYLHRSPVVDLLASPRPPSQDFQPAVVHASTVSLSTTASCSTTSSTPSRVRHPAAGPVTVTTASLMAEERMMWSKDLELDAPFYPSSCEDSRPSSFVFSDPGSAPTSPRASLILSPRPSSPIPSAPLPSFSLPVLPPVTAPVDVTELKRRSHSVYASLVALLQTATPAARPVVRWQALAPDMALQILRSTSASLDLLPALEIELAAHLCNPAGSAVFRGVETHFHQNLVEELSHRVSEFRNLAGVNLFAAATGGRIQGLGRATTASIATVADASASAPTRPERRSRDGGCDARNDGGVEDMATRLAHVGVLHWRVWAPIVYNQYSLILDDAMEVDQR